MTRKRRDDALETAPETSPKTVLQDRKAPGDGATETERATSGAAKAAILHDGVEIKDRRPQRVRDLSDVAAGVISLLVVAAAIAATYLFKGTMQGAETDVDRARQVSSLRWVVDLPMAFLQNFILLIIFVALLIRLLTRKMWAQTIASVIAQLMGFGLAMAFIRLLPLALPSIDQFFIARVTSAVGVGPFELFTATTAFLTAAGSRHANQRIKWAWDTFIALVAIELITSSITIPAALVALPLGTMTGFLTRFAVGSPSSGLWGVDLVNSLRQLGFNPTKISRRTDIQESNPGLSFSDDLTELSRLYHVRNEDGERLTVSVSDEQRHSRGYFSQLWQEIKLEGLSTTRFDNVHAMVEHHMTMLMALRQQRIRVPRVLAMGEAGTSSFLVLQSPEPGHHATRLNLSCASDRQITDLFDQLERAHRRGITHRNITPSSVGVIPAQRTPVDQTVAITQMSLAQLRKAGEGADGPTAEDTETPAPLSEGEAVLYGWAHGDLASSQGHAQMDRVQLLVLCAVETGITRAVDCAQKVYSPGQLATLVPYLQTVIIPKETKQEPGWNRHLIKDLRAEVEKRTPKAENISQAEPVKLARFSARRFLTALLLLVAIIAVFTQLNLAEMIDAVRNANPCWALGACVMGIVSWLGSAVAFGVFVPKDKRKGHIDGIIGTQAVASFTAVSMPAAAGPLTVNTIFLHKIGLDYTQAIATSTADTVAEFSTTFLMFLVLGLFTGSSSLGNALPGKTILIVVGVLAGLIAVAMLIPPLRKYAVTKWRPTIRNYGRQILDLFSQPAVLLTSMLGSIVQNTTLAASFWMSLMAFGYNLNFIETLFLFLLSNAIGSAVPTPGGLGAVETVVSVAFTGVGVPSTIAVSATLLFRLATYWLRMILGYVYMRHMQKHGWL